MEEEEELSGGSTSNLGSLGVIAAAAVGPGSGGGGSDPGSPVWDIKTTLVDLDGNDYLRDHFVSRGIVGSYKLYLCNNQGQKDIFKNFARGYRIQITLVAQEYRYNNLPSSFGGLVDVEFGVGYLPIVTKKIKVSQTDEYVRFDFYYQPTEFDLRKTGSRNLWIRRATPGVLKVVDSRVEYISITYDTIYNNTLFEKPTGLTTSYFVIPTESAGKTILTSIGNKSGDITSIKFGNGKFKRGIWKTGVWNDGWRALWDNTEDLYYFDKINLNTFQLSRNMWILKIDSNTNPENVLNINSNISVNDFVTLSNVVGIDINEERYLLKDYYRVSQIDISGSVITITLEIPISKFPLRRFEVDSDKHLVCVTKNMWLGGSFLNGYFRGIWNYGLFKGFPFTTLMEDSHFVDGKFDGGRFVSRISGITSSNSEFREYHTGLVQFFEFYDNNISETEGFNNYIDNTYQSWIDVNYYTQSFVNLNSLTSIYDENFGKKVPTPNLYGYPTYDVLSSISKFKNTTDSGVDYYSLGTKYKIFTDHLGDNGYFRKAFNSQQKPGLEEFVSAGWTANTGNFYGTPTVSFFYNSNITRRNVNRMSIVMATFGYNVLNNNNIRVDDKKYTVVEYDLEYFQRGFDSNAQQYTNTFLKPLNLLGSNYPSSTNIYKNNLIKTEYFYNKNALDLILRYNSEYIPQPESIAMFGFNYTHSLTPNGETSPSYSTTYSLVMPQTVDQYQQIGDVQDWEAGQGYEKYKVVRRPSDDAFGVYFISLIDNNNDELNVSSSWARTMVGFNHPTFENNIFEQSENFSFFTSVRINYFKFLEIDALPFFKYWDYEINFSSTGRNGSVVELEFTKPHGLKKNDIISLKLDETKFNPQYERDNVLILSVSDGPKKNGDVEYTVKTNIKYGTQSTYLSESGTVKKDGDRIDKRIQTNYYATSPKVDGLDENFVYLGNNQIFVDRYQF